MIPDQIRQRRFGLVIGRMRFVNALPLHLRKLRQLTHFFCCVRKDSGIAEFHAGTARTPDGVVTAGGRVLGVTGLGDTFTAARERAYAGVRRVRFDGMHYRSDIGARALRTR